MRQILLHSCMDGNMEALYAYANKHNLAKQLKANISLVQNYDRYFGSKRAGRSVQVKEYLQKYDVVVSDYTTRLYARAKHKIYMSHGYGTKLTPGKNELYDRRAMAAYRYLLQQMDYIVTLSERDSTYFLKDDRLRVDRTPPYLPLGLPRNDALHSLAWAKQNRVAAARYFPIRDRKIILYAPTWRGYPADNPLTRLALSRLDQALGELGYVMLVRAHYLSPKWPSGPGSGYRFIFSANPSTIRSTQALLSIADVLITDYSSIFVDFLLTGRPIVFFPYDLAEYEVSRGLAVDFHSSMETPGPKAYSVNMLIDALSRLALGADSYAKNRAFAKALFHKHDDGLSSQRVWNLISGCLRSPEEVRHVIKHGSHHSSWRKRSTIRGEHPQTVR